MPVKPNFKPFAIAVLVVALAACSAATIISYIDAALQVALQASSLTGVIPPVFTSYISAGLGCIDYAATETATMDSNAAKSANITAHCAALVTPALPPGLPQNLVTLANNLATKIADMLSHLPAQPPVGGLAAGKPEYLKLSPSDRSKLAGIAAQAKAAEVKMEGKLSLDRRRQVESQPKAPGEAK